MIDGRAEGPSGSSEHAGVVRPPGPRFYRPRYDTRVAMTNLGVPKAPSALVAAIVIVSSAVLTLSMAHLAFRYLRLSESYTRLILG